ncbi:porin [Burkholderia lata]|uniref:porin n=1 Tax=Burkholderia lata (strain ATCC 17760 / DSM 23089 / LMG 22485 / NCIMB 9086 / R18194 / 383) TaxID=482957 RepID=UPI0014539FCB|nr:porin [Burkholderia lata]VWB87593.1 porin [Burkholderia lata]
MKKLITCIALAGVPIVASAQSSVTLYGLVNDGVRWVSNTDGGATIKAVGILLPSRFGLIGTEDLGGGVQALFRLENSFNVNNGALTGNLLFQPGAFIGIDGAYGRFTMGRQFTAFEDLTISLDPQSIAGADVAIAPNALIVSNIFIGDTRFNNTVKYAYTNSGVKSSASYSFGGVAGNQLAGSNYAFQISAQRGPLYAGIGYQRTYNPDATQTAQNFQVGGAVQVGQARLFISYLELLVSGKGSLAAERRDCIPQGGIAYQITPALSVTAAYYYDIARNLGNVGGASGHKTTAYIIGEYFLSKRTEVYVEVDRNSFSGAYKSDPTNLAAFNLKSGTNSTVGVSAGLVTRF